MGDGTLLQGFQRDEKINPSPLYCKSATLKEGEQRTLEKLLLCILCICITKKKPAISLTSMHYRPQALRMENVIVLGGCIPLFAYSISRNRYRNSKPTRQRESGREILNCPPGPLYAARGRTMLVRAMARVHKSHSETCHQTKCGRQAARLWK